MSGTNLETVTRWWGRDASRETAAVDDSPSDSSMSVLATRAEIAFLGVFYILIAFILFYLLLKVWPPARWPLVTAADGVTQNNPDVGITFFKGLWGGFQLHTSLDQRLFFLVIVAGALGAYIHSATSFTDYVGNRKMARSWIWWYLLRLFVGVTLALVFYFVVRAGFLTGGASDVSPYGVATLAALAGMFSKQATDKLEEVFTVLFKPSPGKGDAKRGDKLNAPTITSLTPKEGPSSGGTEVTITGTGFVDKPSVLFGNKSAAVTFESVTTIKALAPEHEPAEVEVTVKNPDGQEASPKERFTYTKPSEESENGLPINAGANDGNVETIDGCDIDVVEETPDEDLPMTEGGVA